MSKKQAPVKTAPAKKRVKKGDLSKAQALTKEELLVNTDLANKAMSLRAKFLNLPKAQQDACVHYFNLYNALGYWWNEILSGDARDYVDSQIMYAEELRALENKDKDALEKQGVDTSDYHPDEETALV